MSSVSMASDIGVTIADFTGILVQVSHPTDAMGVMSSRAASIASTASPAPPTSVSRPDDAERGSGKGGTC